MDLQFGQYRLRRKQREVLGPKDPLDLSARSFDILALLLSRPDEVISKTALFEAVWPGLVVEDNTLQVHISALRKALDAGMIMTVHGRGYKYAGPRPIAAPSESALENQAGGQSSATLRHVEGSAPTVVEADSKRYGPQASGISVAVLPFVSISSNSEDDFLADGLTEDMITELSRLKNFLVIASNTAFTYKGRSVDVAQVGRELQVRYVLEGSMRKAGSRVRITAQLIDTDSGTHVWAERFDREHSELFDIQDEVVRAVAASTQTQLMIRESGSRLRRASDDCWTLTMGATAEIYKMTAQKSCQ